VQTTFFLFLILFTILLIAEIGIMVKAIKKGPEEIENGKLKIENEGDN
jgi:cytochrome d ubiquinol oxidase subunit I